MARTWIEALVCPFLCLCIFSYVDAITLPGNHDVSINGPDIAPDGNSFSLSCDCRDFMRSVYQMDPNFAGTFTVEFFSEGKMLDSVTFNPGGLSCDANLVFGQGGLQDKSLNSNISCKVSTSVNKPGLPPQPAESTSDGFYLGFTVERNPMVVKEGETQTLRVISNVPILCKDTPDCCVTLNLKIPSNKNNIAAISKCNYDMCTSHWTLGPHPQAVVDIPLIANKDPADDTDKDMTVAFDPLTPAGGGQVHQLLTNLKIPEVDVKLVNEPHYICTITGDPHIHTFQNIYSMVHLYEMGEFMFYSNPAHDVEIHGKTWPCNNRASCLCSLIIRQGREILRVSICDQVRLPTYMRGRRFRHRMQHVLRNTHMTLKTPYGGLPDGAQVFSDYEARYMQILFASGLKVEVKHPNSVALYAKVTAPPTHAQGLSGQGLCGTPGKNFSQILTKGDGTITTCSFTGRGCYDKDFNLSWRLKQSTSMYQNPPSLQNINKVSTRGQDYCTCTNPATAPNSTINCDFSGNQNVKLKDCTHCTDVTNTLPPGLFGGTFRIDTLSLIAAGYLVSFKRDLSAHVAVDLFGNATVSGNVTDDENSPDYFTFDADEYLAEFPEYIAPSIDAANPLDAVTEATIRQKCTEAIHSSVMMDLCKDLTDIIDSSIEECMDDFLVTNQEDMLESSVHAFNMVCQFHLEKDPANYETGSDGIREMRDAATVRSTCSQTCNTNGKCQNGTCVCNPGWEGNHCAINLNATTLTPNGTTPAGQITTTTAVVNATVQPSVVAQMCDVFKSDCTKVNVSPPSGLLPGDSVSCRFETSMRQDVVTSGVVNKTGDCDCPLPRVNVGRNIGLAYVDMTVTCESGSAVSAPNQFIVYDSRCVDSTLTQNASVCIIDSLCYEDGVINPANDYEGCSSVQSMNSWTAVTHQMLRPSEIDLKLTGPDPHTILMTCALPAPATVDLTVDWMINGVKFKSQPLAKGQDRVELKLFDVIESLVGNPGKLTCQVKDTSVSPSRIMVSQEWTIVV